MTQAAGPEGRVFAVVQMPPAVSGLTTMNAAIVRRLEESGLLRAVCSTAPKVGLWRPLAMASRLLLTLAAIIRMARSREQGATDLYLSCDGGVGLALNLMVVMAARLIGMRIWLHHHSFAYIDRRSWLMGAIMTLGPKGATHIALCEDMLSGLSRRYEKPWRDRALRGLVLSNAFAIDASDIPPHPKRGELVLGHLSNLTVEKGVLGVLALFERLRSTDNDVRLVVAGPASDPRIRSALKEAAARHGARFDWLGPVRGAAKARFLSEIDVFVFPTRYANEAQPLVLLEALAAGAAVLATDRGCIACDLDQSPGRVMPYDTFQRGAEQWLGEVVAGDRPDRRPVRAAFATLKDQSERQLLRLLEKLGRAPAEQEVRLKR